MRSRFSVYVLLLFFLARFQRVDAQGVNETGSHMDIRGAFFSGIEKEASKAVKQIDQQTAKYLEKLRQQENRLKKKLLRRDSARANDLFGGVSEEYPSLKEQSVLTGDQSIFYSGRLDSLTTLLLYLKSNRKNGFPDSAGLEQALQSLTVLQAKLNQSEQLSSFLRKRLALFSSMLPQPGVQRIIKSYIKQVYYYGAQVQAYKTSLENARMPAAGLVKNLLKLPQFQDFFARRSQLGQLFHLPVANRGPAAFSVGLQTRQTLNDQLLQRGGSAAEASRVLQQAGRQVQDLRDQLKANAGSELVLLPRFKPNNQWTKNFRQRLEWGLNMQTARAGSFFPLTADIGFSAGYNLNDKSMLGIGAAYKLGLGRGWEHIALSHQGAALRSFATYELKWAVYLSGGYEQNYRRVFTSLNQLKERAAWQSSGLIGLNKKYGISKKTKGNIQLLWDFLSYRQVPKSQPIVFRVGFSRN
ncbi:hypothetical protein V9K67_03910 [Paraflavisolibacter sp. H34]|uniref:hypothetical protein n=1 Tax=Huijunlia imazamoxiresistens TaxID=3127457 RepID=UPI00301835AF